MRSWRVRFLVVLGIVALVAGGCGDDGGAPTPAGDGAAREDGGEAQEVSIVAADYEFTDAPAKLEGGAINLSFENQGTVAHEVALAGIGDMPVDQFVEEFGPVLEGGPFPDYLDQVAVPIEVEGGVSAEATFTITEGNYVMFCALTGVAEGDKEKAPHYELGMIQELTVSGGDAEPQLPEADGTIAAIDYAFEADLEAGDSSVNFVNEGPDQVHFASVSVYPEGTDAAAAEKAFKAGLEEQGGGQQPEGPQPVGFSGIFSDGLGSSFQLFEGEFESGRTYLFACFISDRAGGPPHAIAYDMYEAVTIE